MHRIFFFIVSNFDVLKNHIVHKSNPRFREVIYVRIVHLIRENAFANDIAFIDIGQLKSNQDVIIEVYNLRGYVKVNKL